MTRCPWDTLFYLTPIERKAGGRIYEKERIEEGLKPSAAADAESDCLSATEDRL